MNTFDMNDNSKIFMGLALELAKSAYENDEVPVGAVIVQRRNSEVLAAFSNQMRAQTSAIAHAEILAIQKATNVLRNERLVGCDMYVSLEPCPMCAHAISLARLDTLYFAAEDKKSGGVLNIVRRKVELKCLAENIPGELVVDLENVDIGESFKISSIKLPDRVTPTIQGRDFVIATLAAPTVMKEPEKPAEAEAAEGEEGAEGATAAAADGDKAAPEGDKGDKKEGDDKKPADKKPPEEKK